MTVQNQNFRVQFSGNGVTTQFSYNFKILAVADIGVYLDNVLQTTGFSVNGVGDNKGGNVTFTTAPASGVKVTLIRSLPRTQLLDYIAGGKFPAASHEQGLDLLVMLDQQTKEVLNRMLFVPVTSQSHNMEIPDPDLASNQGKILQLTATGWQFVAVATTDIATPLVAKGDLITHDGTVVVKVPVGTNGQYLVVDSTTPEGFKWTDTLTVGHLNTAGSGPGQVTIPNNTGAINGLNAAGNGTIQIARVTTGNTVVINVGGTSATAIGALASHTGLTPGDVGLPNAGAIRFVNAAGVTSASYYIRSGAADNMEFGIPAATDEFQWNWAGVGNFRLRKENGGAGFEFLGEASADFAATGANRAVVYARDDGGNTSILARFNTGRVERIATQGGGLAVKKATTSGTSHDFVNIPSWARRITVMCNAVSTSGVSDVIVQLGDAGGFETAGYTGAMVTIGVINVAFTSGFIYIDQAGTADVFHGVMTLTLYDSTNNTWMCSSTSSKTNATTVGFSTGSKSLSAILTQVRLTTVGGSETFDAGSVNIYFE